MRLTRALAALGAASVIAACSPGVQGEYLGPGAGVSAVYVSPLQALVPLGDTLQMAAVVIGTDGNASVSQAVSWTISPDTSAIFISPAGVVRACYPGGQAIVTATSLLDTAQSGHATVTTPPIALTGVSIARITRTGTTDPANLDSLTGSVDVTANADPRAAACHPMVEADLVISRATGDTVVDRQPVDTTATTSVPVLLTFNSAAQNGGARAFPDGAYAMRISLVYAGLASPWWSSTINFTVRNP